jgi:hypothetical protein
MTHRDSFSTENALNSKPDNKGWDEGGRGG